MTLAGPRIGTDNLREEGLRGGIAVQNIVFAPLFIIDDELHGQPGAVGPVGLGRGGAIADHVAGIVAHGCSPRITPRMYTA